MKPSREPPDSRLRPPAAAQWLLGRLLPEDIRESFLGDAEERFRHDVAERGRTMAALVYWSELVRSRWLTLHWETSKKAGLEMNAETSQSRAPLTTRLMDQIRGDVKHG